MLRLRRRYLKDAHTNLLRDISQMLNAMVFAPKELLDVPATLYILRKGVAAKKGMPMVQGAIGGTDFVCEDEDDMDHTAACALTHVEVCVNKTETRALQREPHCSAHCVRIATHSLTRRLHGSASRLS